MVDFALPPQVPRIIGLIPEVAPREYALEAEVCTLGRATGCDVVVTGLLISRLHATITRGGPHFLLSDAGSRNGTFVNGSRLAGVYVLADEDVLGLGAPIAQLRFMDPDRTALAELLALPDTAHDRLYYDPQSMRFFLDAERLELTLLQFKLLSHLYQHAGAVCSRERCAEAIWGRDYDSGLDAGALDQAFNSLRRALARVDPTAQWIQTRRGLGYVLSLTGAALSG